ncbi:hypothetical protein PVAG01_10875 [Phlyctema vagabunda]|uniref:Uncharacterized protein n=1 Tax=Phlyctema vagabunda TaxID=108571 RepID=A0ABR4P3I5_9HELO
MDQLLPRSSDAAIWAAIDSKNFKQALKTVEKRLSKKPQDQYLKALSCYIYSELAQLSSEKTAARFDARRRASVCLIAFCKGPLIVENDILTLYDEALIHSFIEPITWWRNAIGIRRLEIVKNSPKDLDLGRDNFRICLEKHDFTHAQQICNSLEKNFPAEHKFVLWNITLHHMIHESGHADDNRELSGRLSQAMIQKLAEATKVANDVKSLPVRSIQTPQEAILLHTIIANSTSVSDDRRLDYFSNEYAGPESKIAKGSWKLWLDKLQLIKTTGKWEDLYALSSRLLPMARKNSSGNVEDSRMGDWQVWDVFLKTARLLFDHEKCLKTVTNEAKLHLEKDSGCDKIYRRNAALALVVASCAYLDECSDPYFVVGEPDIAREDATLLESEDARSQMIRVMVNYMDENAGSPSLFSDVNDCFLFYLDKDEDGMRELLHRLSKIPKFGIAPLPIQQGEVPENEQKACIAENHLTTASDITACVNKFKIIYTITCSISEHTRRIHNSTYSKVADVQRKGKTKAVFQCAWCESSCQVYCKKCLATQARSSILTYGSAIDDNGRITSTLLPTDMHPADDLCIIAAMCLIKIAGILPYSEQYCKALRGKAASYLLRAALLLEYAWSHSKANAQISLLLVRIYTQLGCGSLAMRAYQRLGLKQIQLMTLSYTLFDRISSLHPHPFVHLQDDGAKIASPSNQLQNYLKVFKRFEGQVNTNIYKAFEHGNYDSAIQLFNAGFTIKHSLAVVSCFIELRKINRVLHPNDVLDLATDGFDMLPENPEHVKIWKDNLDSTSFPNFEAKSQPPFLDCMQLTPGPNPLRSQLELVIERVKYHLDLERSDPRLEESTLWFMNEFPRLGLSELAIDPSHGTCFEQSYLKLGLLLAKLMATMERDNVVQWEIAYQIFKCVTCELQVALISLHQAPEGLQIPAFSNTLHPIYLAYDIATFVLKFNKYFQAHPRSNDASRALSQNCAKSAQKVMTEVLTRSQVTRRNMDESGWIDKVLDMVMEGETNEVHGEPQSIAGAFRATVDADFLETWAGEVVESWRDSVMGLACLKPPADKSMVIDIEDTA